jgi:hypothetical protein
MFKSDIDPNLTFTTIPSNQLINSRKLKHNKATNPFKWIHNKGSQLQMYLQYVLYQAANLKP